ncbi:hypothetical protein [Neobacillus sp. LXY-1]|uniref:hypothetical protein n=1 Tax=Neobacillus sp. LXY-1 TaxID=3379133 RepID=UPI003EE09DB2
MRLLKSILLILLIFFSLTGCNEQQATLDGKAVTSISVAKVSDSMQEIHNPHVIYYQKNGKELKTFIEAIHKAKKINGVVDVAVPDYLLTLTFEDQSVSKYTLSIGPDSGSIMNENDTNTLYKLPSFVIKDLNTYVKSKK